MNIRKAKPDEHKFLSELAENSKAYWGYTKEFIEACRNELTYSAEELKNPDNHFAVAELENRVVGFYALVPSGDDTLELEALFVDRDYIGKGIGRRLINDAKIIASERGAKSIIIQGDPNAENFYLTVGCKRIDERESGSIPGRYLPLFSLDLPGKGKK